MRSWYYDARDKWEHEAQERPYGVAVRRVPPVAQPPPNPNARTLAEIFEENRQRALRAIRKRK